MLAEGHVLHICAQGLETDAPAFWTAIMGSGGREKSPVPPTGAKKTGKKMCALMGRHASERRRKGGMAEGGQFGNAHTQYQV